MKNWYQVKASAEYADVYIYDEIGAYGISAKDFISELSQYKGKPLTIHINSGGGSVFDGQSMSTAIKNHEAPVTTVIEGVAASMATIIALSGDSVHMTENSLFMIHNPMLDSFGDKNELSKAISLLEKIEISMLNTYSNKTNLPNKDLSDMMNDETWFTADEALSAGFIDKVIGEVKVAANFNSDNFKSKTHEEIINVLNGENNDKLNTTEEMNDKNKNWFAAQFDKIANLIGNAEVQVEQVQEQPAPTETIVQEVTEPEVENNTPDFSEDLDRVTKERDELLKQVTVSQEEQLDYGKEIETMRQRINQLEATPSVSLGVDPSPIATPKEEQSSWDKLAQTLKH
jgi:ATP-dependent protease ClpP protease subunit